MKKIVALIIIAIATLLVTNAYGGGSIGLQELSKNTTKSLIPDCEKLLDLYKEGACYKEESGISMFVMRLCEYKLINAICDAADYCYDNADSDYNKEVWLYFSGNPAECQQIKNAFNFNYYEKAKEKIYDDIKDVNTDGENGNIIDVTLSNTSSCDSVMESATSIRVADDILCKLADDCIDEADTRKELNFWQDIKVQCSYK